VLDTLHVVMDNPFNNYGGVDTTFDLDGVDIQLDEVQDRYELDM